MKEEHRPSKEFPIPAPDNKMGTFVESAALEETMSPKVMQTIADWILREMIKKPSK